ncbi:MAG TPA: DUF2167 domain-containing protein [Pseudomonadales bacterium]|nr:DUF2167 domain-containing protein [Pseudomonadales bacterium]
MNVRYLKSFGGWKRSVSLCLVPVLAVLFTFYSQCQAQQASGSLVPADSNIGWAAGPQHLNLGDYAYIDVPAGYRMTDAHGARIILDSLNTPVPDNLIGALSDTDGKWWAVMEYSPKGFVKDGEQINSAAVLKALQANGQANASLDWQSAPVYDPQMHALSWSLQSQNASKKESSQAIVLLGRNGFVKITSYQPVPSADLSALKQLAASINFNDGERYADFQSGDQVARMGLSDLIVGQHTAKAAMGHGFGGSTAAWIYSGIFVCLVAGGVVVLRRNKVSKTASPAHVTAPAVAARAPVAQSVVSPALAAKPFQPAIASSNGNGHQNGAASEFKKNKQFHRNRRKKIFNYPKFYTNVMRELSLHSYGPGHYVNGKSGSNGHANGHHHNGATNGHANGHANGHTNGHSNGSNGVNEAIKGEIAALIANQKNLIEEQKCLLEQQTKLIAEKRWLIEEQSAFLKGQAENQFPLKFE